MFTRFDKAIAALIGSAVFFAGYLGLDLGEWLPPDRIAQIGAILAPLLTYLIPNKAT